MRKILVALVIVLILGATVFFVGWIQLSIPPGTFGVIFSKTSGWESEVVEPGEFVWRWQRLIPSNLTLYRYEPLTRQTRVSLNGTLPSGTAIETLLETRDAFDYEVRLLVTSRIDPSALPRLTREEGLVPDELDPFLVGLDAQITRIAMESVIGLVEETPERISLSAAHSSISESVQSRIERQFPYLEILGVAPTQIDLPDLDLYVTARDLIDEVMRARADALTQAANDLAPIQAESDRELLLLERYGQILENYPVLLDYFQVGQEIGADPLNIEDLIPQPGQ